MPVPMPFIQCSDSFHCGLLLRDYLMFCNGLHFFQASLHPSWAFISALTCFIGSFYISVISWHLFFDKKDSPDRVLDKGMSWWTVFWFQLRILESRYTALAMLTRQLLKSQCFPGITSIARGLEHSCIFRKLHLCTYGRQQCHIAPTFSWKLHEIPCIHSKVLLSAYVQPRS